MKIESAVLELTKYVQLSNLIKSSPLVSVVGTLYNFQNSGFGYCGLKLFSLKTRLKLFD